MKLNIQFSEEFIFNGDKLIEALFTVAFIDEFVGCNSCILPYLCDFTHIIFNGPKFGTCVTFLRLYHHFGDAQQ